MSALSEMYMDKINKEQRKMDEWSDLDMQEDLIQSMEKQVESKEWENLKNESSD